jgi:hypothetical protein
MAASNAEPVLLFPSHMRDGRFGRNRVLPVIVRSFVDWILADEMALSRTRQRRKKGRAISLGCIFGDDLIGPKPRRMCEVRLPLDRILDERVVETSPKQYSFRRSNLTRIGSMLVRRYRDQPVWVAGYWQIVRTLGSLVGSFRSEGEVDCTVAVR